MIGFKNVLPVSDLRSKLGEIENICSNNKETVLLTKNGRSKLVIVDAIAYEEEQKELETLRKEVIEYKFALEVHQGLLEVEVNSRRDDVKFTLEDLKKGADEIIDGNTKNLSTRYSSSI